MKTVSGSVIASKPISLSKASSILSSFISFENGASHAISAYLRRTSASINGLVQFHGDLKCGKSERKRKKSRLETIDNGILVDAVKNYSLGEEQSNGYTEEGVINEEVMGSGRKKKKKRSDFQDQLPEVEKRESEEHGERKKRKKMEVEDGELDDAEEGHSRVKKRKH